VSTSGSRSRAVGAVTRSKQLVLRVQLGKVQQSRVIPLSVSSVSMFWCREESSGWVPSLVLVVGMG